ncbi:MAG: hypothetical protein FWD97_06335 [Defluviitaleaceae bacterium]|nr:hypothetical protein [Defluviitaleaceae bacterium]
MTNIYESNPRGRDPLCPKGSFGREAGLASRPFSACGDCHHSSHMSCTATSAISQEIFPKMQKKPCNFFGGVL